MEFKQQFLEKWSTFFGDAELPIIFYYTDDENQAKLNSIGKEHRCVICDLNVVRQGKSRWQRAYQPSKARPMARAAASATSNPLRPAAVALRKSRRFIFMVSAPLSC